MTLVADPRAKGAYRTETQGRGTQTLSRKTHKLHHVNSRNRLTTALIPDQAACVAVVPVLLREPLASLHVSARRRHFLAVFQTNKAVSARRQS